MNNKGVLFVIAAMALLLGACGSTGPVPQDNFYRLQRLVIEKPFPHPPVDGIVKVGRIDAFGLFRERAILFTKEDTPQAISRHHYHHWVDAPTSLIRDHLIGYLRDAKLATLVDGSYVAQGYDYQLDLELKDFTRVLKANGDVAVSVELNAVFLKKSAGVPLFVLSYSQALQADNATMPASVKAFRKALAEIYPRITDDIAKALN